MENNYWDNLIIDSLAAPLTEEREAELNGWLSASEENRAYYNQIKEIWHSSAANKEGLDFDYRKGYDHFRQQTSNASHTSKRRTLRRIAAVAAIAVPFMFLVYFMAQYFRHDAPQVQLSEVTVPKGSKMKMTLADGTAIWLNSGSTMQYDSNFGVENRTLTLNGEAYLEVARDENLPFVINAGKVEVKVLGTVFNVNAYAENEEITVSLYEGAVQLGTQTEQHKTILKPNETASYDVVTGITTVTAGMNNTASEWIENKIVFNGENMQQVARILERSFDVEIRILDEDLKNTSFVGDFVRNESIDEIFKIMSSSQKFRYTIKDNVIEIYK